MDSFNLLIPYDDNEYDRYADIRSDLKYSRNELLELDNTFTDRRYSVPSMAPEIRDLFDDGDLAFLANVGPLTQHMKREQYLDETLKKPLNLESHSDQIRSMANDECAYAAVTTNRWLVRSRLGSIWRDLEQWIEHERVHVRLQLGSDRRKRYACSQPNSGRRGKSV